MPQQKLPAGEVTPRQLYSGKTNGWYQTTEEKIDLYLEVVLRIYEHTLDEKPTEIAGQPTHPVVKNR